MKKSEEFFLPWDALVEKDQAWSKNVPLRDIIGKTSQ